MPCLLGSCPQAVGSTPLAQFILSRPLRDLVLCWVYGEALLGSCAVALGQKVVMSH